MNKSSTLTRILIVMIFAEITYKHEEPIPHTHEDVRATFLPADIINVSGIFSQMSLHSDSSFTSTSL